MKDFKPLAYLILGAAGSGRREVLNDLIDGGIAEASKAVVYVHATENASDKPFREGLEVLSWRREEAELLSDPLPDGVTHIFFLTDGRGNPVDQVELFPNWLLANGAELGRIITVVNCQLVEKNPTLLAWYEACIHFSDVVLLNRRDGVENKWMSGFQRHFDDLFYPCLFELVKGGRVKNPLLILEPQARRMSQVFDERDPIYADVEIGIENEDGEEEEATEEELAERKFEELTPPEEDPYLIRRIGGRRSKVIPDIAPFLSSSPPSA